MRTVEMLRQAAMEEAHSAKEYALCAIEYKPHDPDLSRFFHDLSQTELDHCAEFLRHIDRRVDIVRNSGIELDDQFEEELEHDKRRIIMKHAEAMRLVSMYR